MQILNVGAGRTDEEYKAANEQRRADLLAESRSDANYFFWAAGLAAVASGLFPVKMNFIVNIGAFDLLALYGRRLVEGHPLAGDGVVGAWMMALVGLGLAARGGYRWSFWAGMALYAADMIALMATFSLWAFGVHAFFVFRWFQGQKALKDLNGAGLTTFGKRRVCILGAYWLLNWRNIPITLIDPWFVGIARSRQFRVKPRQWWYATAFSDHRSGQ